MKIIGVQIYDFYIKYYDDMYKLKLTRENGTYKTEAFYGLTKIEVDTENTKVGKTVNYDGKTWTILYDDDTNGLQMICNEVYRNFILGMNDSSITDWDAIFSEVDVNSDGVMYRLEQSLYSYNNAITTLNKACEKLFKDEEGNFKDNIKDVRCVGSNPTDKNLENTTLFKSEGLRWNGVAKCSDFNYVTDYDRMVALEIHYKARS